MKAIYCQDCGDVISPRQRDLETRKCECGRHTVWWRNGSKGLLSIYDRKRYESHEDGTPVVRSDWRPRVWVLGLNNGWLLHPNEQLTKGDYESIVDQTPATYLFKTLGTVAIRIRPGYSNDTKYEYELPK